MKRFVPRLALTAALLAGVFTGAPSLALASDLPQAINDSVTVIHTNDSHGSYKYSYNASKGTGTVGFDGLAVLYSAQGNAPDLLLDAGDTFHGQSFATMSEGKSDEKLYTAKDVNVLLTDPNKGSTYQSILDEVSNNKIKPLDDAFSAASSEVLGTSSTNYFYGEDAAGTHGWEMVRTTDFRPSKKGDTTKTQTIGHVICGSYLDLTGADLAIENAGGIRGGIAAGDVTAGNVIAISPYGNTVETWTMTGADFLAALEHSLQISDECNHSYELQQAYVAAGHTEQEAQDMYKWRDDSGSVLSFGGINVTIDWTQSEGKRIVSATLTKDGSTLDPAKTYTVATNNYIITNTTDFPTFANATKHTEWGTCESALKALIGQNSWESKMASLAGTISFGSAAVDPTPTPVPTPQPSPQTDTTTTKVITKKTTGKLAATGDRTLAMVGACLIGGIVIIILGIIWKRRR